MVGVPGTLKGHIENARWEATTLDPEEKEWVVMTDNEVNYDWFYPIGKGAEAKLVAHLIADAPAMFEVLRELIDVSKHEHRNIPENLTKVATTIVDRVNAHHPPVVRVEDLPKTEEEAKQMARDLGVSED